MGQHFKNPGSLTSTQFKYHWNRFLFLGLDPHRCMPSRALFWHVFLYFICHSNPGGELLGFNWTGIQNFQVPVFLGANLLGNSYLLLNSQSTLQSNALPGIAEGFWEVYKPWEYFRVSWIILGVSIRLHACLPGLHSGTSSYTLRIIAILEVQSPLGFRQISLEM